MSMTPSKLQTLFPYTGKFYKKVDAYVLKNGEFVYFRSSLWYRTCRDFKASLLEEYPGNTFFVERCN